MELPDNEGAAVEVVEGAAPVDPDPVRVGVAGEVTVMTEVDDFRKIPSFDVDVISWGSLFTVGDGVVGGTMVGVGGCKKYSRSKVKQKIFFMANAETSLLTSSRE